MTKFSFWNRHATGQQNGNVFDFTSIGASSTIGLGVFIVIGYVAKYIAGPAVILSILIAAATALLTGCNTLPYIPR